MTDHLKKRSAAWTRGRKLRQRPPSGTAAAGLHQDISSMTMLSFAAISATSCTA